MTDLTPTQKEMAERIAELLARSTLDEDLKEQIVEKIDTLPEEMVSALLEALEEENDQLESIAAKIDKYLTNQEAGWSDIEEEQRKLAEKWSDDMAQNLDDQAKIQELKESIA